MHACREQAYRYAGGVTTIDMFSEVVYCTCMYTAETACVVLIRLYYYRTMLHEHRDMQHVHASIIAPPITE